MTKPDKHSRRDFLRGRAAVRVATAKAQAWIDSASELLGADLEPGPLAHVHASRRAMACEFSVQYHESDSQMQEEVLAALDAIESTEDQLTIYRDRSEVADINQNAANCPVEVDDNLFALLQLCQQLHHETEGAFDITSGPLSRAWGFLQRAGRLPEPAELKKALSQVGSGKIELDVDVQTVRFCNPDLEINFNSIGKGYALDQAAALLDEAGCADYLWQGGGSSVLARGVNRSSRDASWSISLRHPFQTEQRLAEFHLRNRALATAGGATQFFEETVDGEVRQFSHILDPRTGWPATEILTATALAPTAALADGLATAFFVMGVDLTEKYCTLHPQVAAVLVCPTPNRPGFVVHSFGLQEEDWTQS